MTQTNEEIMVENDKKYGIFDTSVFQPKSDIVECEPVLLTDVMINLTNEISDMKLLMREMITALNNVLEK